MSERQESFYQVGVDLREKVKFNERLNQVLGDEQVAAVLSIGKTEAEAILRCSEEGIGEVELPLKRPG